MNKTLIVEMPSAIQILMIEMGLLAIYAHGRIEYDDFMGIRRWTDYVYHCTGKEALMRGVMHAYHSGNDAD